MINIIQKIFLKDGEFYVKTGIYKQEQNQMETLKLKNTVSDIMNSADPTRNKNDN